MINWMSDFEAKLLDNAYKKVFTPTIDCINNLIRGGEYEIELIYQNSETKTKESGIFKLFIESDNDKGLPFKIILPSHLKISGVKDKESYGLFNNLQIKQGERKFTVNADSIIDFKTDFPQIPQTLEGRFLNFKSQNSPNNQNHYYRLVITVKNSDIIYPTSLLEYDKNYMKFDISQWDKQKGLLDLPFLTTKGMFVDLKIKGNHFHLYGIEPMSAYIIDSINEITKEDFIQTTLIIRTALAFLCGKYYRDEVIYLSSNDCNFENIIDYEVQVEENSIISKNQIINPQMFFLAYKQQDDEIKELWKKYHKMFPSIIFSNLCERMIDVPEMFRSVELVINAGYISDPIQKGALYSVALETMRQVLKEQNEENFKPIRLPEISQRFISALKDELDKIKKDIDTNGYDSLVKKIDNINQIGNTDSLKMSFELVKIKLTDEEIKTIAKRNKYLHGNKPINTNEKNKLEKISLELHSLIGRLILRYVGYEGHYIHLPAWYIFKSKDYYDLMQNFDIEELKKVEEKIKNQSFNNEVELLNAKKILDQYENFAAMLFEADKLITLVLEQECKNASV